MLSVARTPVPLLAGVALTIVGAVVSSTAMLTVTETALLVWLFPAASEAVAV